MSLSSIRILAWKTHGRQLVGALFLLTQLQQINLVKSVNNNTNNNISTRSRSNHAEESSSSPPPPSPPRFYANHRMGSIDEMPTNEGAKAAAATNLTTLIHIDHMAASSMPRPQLALQIFTNSPPALPPLHNHQPAPATNLSHLVNSNSNNNNNNNQHQAARLLNTMLVVPFGSLPPKNHRHASDSNGHGYHQQHYHQESGQEGAGHQQAATSSASQRNFIIDLQQPANKINQWHYVTESQQPVVANQLVSSPADSYSREKSQASDGGGGGGGGSSSNSQQAASPLINAIITVPSQSEHHHHHHHQPDDTSQLNQSIDNSSMANVVDQTISQLLDAQATGNIEFNMDFNGEEIVINPVRKHGRSSHMELAANSSRDSLLNRATSRLSDSEDGGSGGDQSIAQVARNRRNRFKELVAEDGGSTHKRHSLAAGHESAAGAENQQSASEIDLVDEAGEDDPDAEFVPDTNKTKRTAQDRTSDSERDDKSDETNYLAASDGGGGGSSGSGSSTDDTDSRLDLGETLNEERAQPRDSDPPGRILSTSSRKNKSTNRSRPAVRSQKQTTTTTQSAAGGGGRLAAGGGGGRRRVTPSRADDASSSEQLGIGRRDLRQSSTGTTKSSNLSAVMIKGEDLKRFEQLLQSLRSASLIEMPGQKRQKRPVGLRRDQQQADDGLANLKREETEPQTTHQADGDAWDQQEPRGRQQSRPTQSSKLNKNELISVSDCDRRKQQQQQQRREWRTLPANSNNDDETGSYESDSSREAVTNSGEPSNDQNDDTYRNQEQDEQSSDNYNSLSLPIRDRDEEEALSPDRASPPRSLFVRKTILQSYYDDNPSQSSPNKRDSTSSSASYKASDEMTSSSDQSGELDTANDRLKSKVHLGSSSDLSRAHDSTRAGNYADYSQSGAREVYRGMPSTTNRTRRAYL